MLIYRDEAAGESLDELCRTSPRIFGKNGACPLEPGIN